MIIVGGTECSVRLTLARTVYNVISVCEFICLLVYRTVKPATSQYAFFTVLHVPSPGTTSLAMDMKQVEAVSRKLFLFKILAKMYRANIVSPGIYYDMTTNQVHFRSTTKHDRYLGWNIIAIQHAKSE
jgi:hypothetical protein